MTANLRPTAAPPVRHALEATPAARSGCFPSSSVRPPLSIRLASSLAAALILASPAYAERLIVRSYTVSDGLGSDRVVCLATDREGFLWICTNGGLSRFDGSRFVTFGIAEGLPDPAVNHFLQTRSGARWVATNGGGIARLEPGMPDGDGRVFTAFDVGTRPRSMRVNVLFEARDGALLAGTDGGLFRAVSPDPEPRFELIPLRLPGFPDGGLQIWAIAEDGAGRTWVGTSAGLVLLRGHEPAGHLHLAPAEGADHVYAFLPDAAGRLWLGHDTGLFVWKPPAGDGASLAGIQALSERATPCLASASGALHAASLPDSPDAACRWEPGGAQPGRSLIRSFYRTQDGWIWMASHAGLAAFDGTRLRVFAAAHGLPSTVLLRVGGDPGGDLWTGSRSGVHHIQRRGFTHFTGDDGLVGPVLQRIFRGPDGNLYTVSSASVIHRLDGEHWIAVRPNLPPFTGTAGRSVYGAVLLDRAGEWWVGTGGGLLRYPVVPRLEALARAEPVAHYTTDHGLAGNDIWHLFEDSRGDIWIASRIPGPEPLTRWDRVTGRFHRYGSAEGLPAERAVHAFVEDPSGALWASFWDGGLARFDGRRFRYFSPGTDVPAGHLTQLLVDRRGWLWVAGRQTFFTREPSVTDPRFETFRTSDGETLFSMSLGEDLEGWIYASTPTGLVRFGAEDRHLQQLGFGRPFTGLRPDSHRDDDGSLWFLARDEVLRYEPQPHRVGGPVPVRIGGVRVAGVPLPVPPMGVTSMPPLRLAAGQRQVQIDYFGIAFGVEGPLRFQVRLDGVDDEWGPPTAQLTVLYAGLGPGRYRFQVRAVSAGGQVSAQPATLAFTIPPPLWRRAWFFGLLGVLATASLVTAHRLRVRRLLELEQVRTRIAADLHDDLGASLARVSLLTEATRRKLRESPETAERMLGEIGETSRALVAAAGDIAYAIDPGRGALDALVARLRRFSEDLLAGNGIDWRFRTEGDTSGVLLSSEQRRHLLAILKEALHNAVRHGQPRHLALTLAVHGDRLQVELVDDGCGFPCSLAHRGSESLAGQGLRNMRQRADELGGRLDIDSRPGAGTRVTVQLPLRPASRMFMR